MVGGCGLGVASVGADSPLRAANHRVSNCQLCLTAIPCQFFHGLGNLLACPFAVDHKAGQLTQNLQRAAHGFNQLPPFDLTNQPKAVDDVADRQVGRHLRCLAFGDQAQAVAAMQVDPVGQHGVGIAGLLRDALPQLG